MVVVLVLLVLPWVLLAVVVYGGDGWGKGAGAPWLGNEGWGDG